VTVSTCIQSKTYIAIYDKHEANGWKRTEEEISTWAGKKNPIIISSDQEDIPSTSTMGKGKGKQAIVISSDEGEVMLQKEKKGKNVRGPAQFFQMSPQLQRSRAHELIKIVFSGSRGGLVDFLE